jgi:hypothetical protein
MRFGAVLFVLFASSGFAASWSGYLVDSKCWDSRQSNVSIDSPTVSRDMREDVVYCSPTDDTRAYAVVLSDWSRLRFDGGGNTAALQFVLTHGEEKMQRVTVDGISGKHKSIQVKCLVPPHRR